MDAHQSQLDFCVLCHVIEAYKYVLSIKCPAMVLSHTFILDCFVIRRQLGGHNILVN